jgi:hypothetical protein
MTLAGFSVGLLLTLATLILVVAIPIKLGAHLADARRTGIFWCLLAAVVGVVAGQLAARLIGGIIGGPLAAFLGFIVAIRYLLGTSLAGALGLTLIALTVSLCGLWALSHLWWVGSAPGELQSV